MPKTVCIDFDGVIHDYKGGWQGYDVIGGEMISGMGAQIRKLAEAGYRVVILSSRARVPEGKEAIKVWLSARGVEIVRDYECVTHEKVPALVYFDDRAIQFRPGMDLLFRTKTFKPWMYDERIQSALQ